MNNREPRLLKIHDVRNLRQAADTLADTADRHRTVLIKHLGLKRYIYNALGKAAHQSTAGVQLVWPAGTETISENGMKLGDYLYARARTEHGLPQAVIVDGKKYYL